MRRSPRTGFVLVAALVALIVIALLITGAFFASGQDFAVTRAELRDQQVFAYAEYAAVHALEDWDASARALMSIGQTQTVQSTTDSPFEATVLTTRLDTLIYAITSEARIATIDGTGLRRRIGITVLTSRSGGSAQVVRVPEQAWSELY
jgi:type II secretory pathway pseudopilin PulG